jgi:perosamine synthetase
MSRIYYTKPSITELEVRYAADAAATQWGDRHSEYLERFEAGFRKHLGARHAIATSSCTGAIHLGFAGLGIRPGDEVILADINWIASVAPLVHLGAKPVFVDVLPDSWCIDPAKAEAAITPKTKAILAVHLYGNLCDMDALLDIGKRRGIAVVEDAAEALGSIWHGKRAGSMGAFASFSFHGSKTITTGEGGMFVTDDTALYERVLMLSSHGRARGEKRHFWPAAVGYKYKMSAMQAAIGCAQLERIDALLARKREIFAAYRDRLRGLPVKLNPEPSGTVNGYWMPTFVVDEGTAFDRESLLASFKQNDIDARVFFWPLSMLPMFERRPENRVSYGVYPRAMNLPSYHDMTDADLAKVCGLVAAALKGKHGSHH